MESLFISYTTDGKPRDKTDRRNRSEGVVDCGPVAKSGLTLCDPMDCSTPGFPVLHYLPAFAQTHMH